MATDILNVKKELGALDQKILDMLIKRFELCSYIADAKYALFEGGEIKVINPQRHQKLLEYYGEHAFKKAKDTNIQNPEEFAKFATRIAEEMLYFSWEMQKQYLEDKYDLKCN